MKACILDYDGHRPAIAADAFIAPTAAVVGQVEIGSAAGIWFQCILRGDTNWIRVGARTNIQDGTVVHVTRGKHPTDIGADVTIGHRAIIHGCTLQDGCFIGMAATVMDGCVVESGAMIAAGSLLTPGKRVPAGSLWGGQPARFMRPVTPAELAGFADTARHYAALAARYRTAAVDPETGRDLQDLTLT